MSINSKRIEYFQHIPNDAMTELVAQAKSYDPSFTSFKDMEEVIDFIREDYNRDKEIDSCYITYTYRLETTNFKFEAVGQCYLKDSCICDEQMLDEIFILDKREIEAANLAEQRQKQLDKIFAKETSDAKWVELFTRIKNSNGTMDDLLIELKGYKFPTETLTI